MEKKSLASALAAVVTPKTGIDTATSWKQVLRRHHIGEGTFDVGFATRFGKPFAEAMKTFATRRARQRELVALPAGLNLVVVAAGLQHHIQSISNVDTWEPRAHRPSLVLWRCCRALVDQVQRNRQVEGEVLLALRFEAGVSVTPQPPAPPPPPGPLRLVLGASGFVPSAAFAGAQVGSFFGRGDRGMGYYVLAPLTEGAAAAASASQDWGDWAGRTLGAALVGPGGGAAAAPPAPPAAALPGDDARPCPMTWAEFHAAPGPAGLVLPDLLPKLQSIHVMQTPEEVLAELARLQPRLVAEIAALSSAVASERPAPAPSALLRLRVRVEFGLAHGRYLNGAAARARARDASRRAELKRLKKKRRESCAPLMQRLGIKNRRDCAREPSPLEEGKPAIVRGSLTEMGAAFCHMLELLEAVDFKPNDAFVNFVCEKTSYSRGRVLTFAANQRAAIRAEDDAEAAASKKKKKKKKKKKRKKKKGAAAAK